MHPIRRRHRAQGDCAPMDYQGSLPCFAICRTFDFNHLGSPSLTKYSQSFIVQQLPDFCTQKVAPLQEADQNTMKAGVVDNSTIKRAAVAAVRGALGGTLSGTMKGTLRDTDSTESSENSRIVDASTNPNASSVAKVQPVVSWVPIMIG